MNNEKCSKCCREIGELETAFVYKDHTVCQKCYKQLTGETNNNRVLVGIGIGLIALSVFVRYQKDRSEDSVAEAVLASASAQDAVTDAQKRRLEFTRDSQDIMWKKDIELQMKLLELQPESESRDIAMLSLKQKLRTGNRN